MVMYQSKVALADIKIKPQCFLKMTGYYKKCTLLLAAQYLLGTCNLPGTRHYLSSACKKGVHDRRQALRPMCKCPVLVVLGLLEIPRSLSPKSMHRQTTLLNS